MSAKVTKGNENTKLQYFLKSIDYGINTVLGIIPFIVSVVKNFGATTINFLGLFVAAKNIKDNVKDIYNYINGKQPQKGMLYVNIALIVMYNLYFIVFAVMVAISNTSFPWLVRISYFALLPVKDIVATVMYAVITAKIDKK